jgi:hypothetical protein
LRDQSRMPVVADAAEAVIAEAEEVIRLAAARQEARQRRRALQAEARRQRQEERDQKAAGRREREQAAEQRLREAADEARRPCWSGRRSKLVSLLATSELARRLHGGMQDGRVPARRCAGGPLAAVT